MRQIKFAQFILVISFFGLSAMASKYNPESSQVKKAAFEILESRCNTCHITKNPSKVFTLENMDQMSKRINRQVFVFKRMPKGKENRQNMTVEEFEILKDWIKQSKSNQ